MTGSAGISSQSCSIADTESAMGDAKQFGHGQGLTLVLLLLAAAGCGRGVQHCLYAAVYIAGILVVHFDNSGL